MTTSEASGVPSAAWFRADALSRPVRWTTLGVLVLVAVSRSPYLLVHGRFFAEEGTFHFREMYLTSSPGDLLYVQTRTGYYNLFANGATWLASDVPLRYAPLVTAWLSFGVVVLVAWVSLAWPSDLLPTGGSKVAAAVLLVVGPLALAEAWFNSINAQTYLGVLVLLLVFVRVDELTKPRYLISVAMLLVAGLSGLYSVALAPLFLVCAWRDRSIRRWRLAGTITAAAAVQAAILVHSRLSGQLVESKSALPGPGEASRSVAGFHLDGLVLRQPMLRALVQDAREGSRSATIIMLCLAAAVVILLAVLLSFAPSHRVSLLLLGAFVLVEGLVLVGDLGGEAAGRYAVVPVAILTLALIHGTAVSARRLHRGIGLAVTAVVLVVGLSQFWTESPKLLRCIDCPDWATEVQKYDDGLTVSLLIWPYPKIWVVRLAPDPPPSSP